MYESNITQDEGVRYIVEALIAQGIKPTQDENGDTIVNIDMTKNGKVEFRIEVGNCYD